MEKPQRQAPALDTIEVFGSSVQDGSVIWLHGLGADGHDFEPIVPELGLAGQLSLRFVFPHAPVRPVTINGGIPMRAWYDILTLDRDGLQDESGIRASSAALHELVQREHERGQPFERIALAGFSQGGAIALHTALRFEQRLAGVMALSTYLPMPDRLPQERAEANRDLPVFMAHGTLDPMLPVTLGQQSRDALAAAGYAVRWREYPMAHAVCATEIADIRNWLLEIFGRG